MSLYKIIQPLLTGAGMVSAPVGHIYIYKITCKRTGEYYIGQTEMVKRRLYRHFSCIKRTINGAECMALPFHKAFSERIKNGRTFISKVDIDHLIISSLSFTILHISERKQDADKHEYAFVDHLDKLCLNKRLN